MRQGVDTMRLPFWNSYAYAKVSANDSCAVIYDVIGEPFPVLITECDKDDRWVPAEHA